MKLDCHANIFTFNYSQVPHQHPGTTTTITKWWMNWKLFTRVLENFPSSKTDKGLESGWTTKVTNESIYLTFLHNIRNSEI